MEQTGISPRTKAEVAAARIIDDIRAGVLVPDHKLRVGELRERYGIGASPLREALSIVMSFGYATGESHRGYRVSTMSPTDLEDITYAREIIEVGMLRDSMLAHGDEWEIGIIAAHERLKRLAARSSLNPMDGAEPIKLAHKRLHVALTAGCSSKRLAKMQLLLFDQADRYRNLMLEKIHDPGQFVEVHDTLVQTVLGGNVHAACGSLREHLRRTLRDVYVS